MDEGWDDLVGDWQPAQGKATLVLDGGEPLIDGQVVLLHVMAKALKEGATVCLLSTQAKSHYQAAARKLGVNLSHHESEGSFSYDALIPAIAPSPGTGGSQLASAVQAQSLDAVDFSSDAQPRRGISVMRLEVPSGNMQDSFGAATLDVHSCVRHVAETLKGMGDRTMILIDDLTIVAGVFGEVTSVSLVQSVYGLARWLKVRDAVVERCGRYDATLSPSVGGRISLVTYNMHTGYASAEGWRLCWQSLWATWRNTGCVTFVALFAADMCISHRSSAFDVWVQQGRLWPDSSVSSAMSARRAVQLQSRGEWYQVWEDHQAARVREQSIVTAQKGTKEGEVVPSPHC